MKLLKLTATFSLIALQATFAFGEARIAGKPASSCSITAPVKLKASEKATLEAKGYSVQVVRHMFKHSRVGGAYEYYESKDSAPVGSLQLRTIKVPSYRKSYMSRREFALNIVLPVGSSTVGLAQSTPPLFATHGESTTEADFSSFPTCTEL